MKKASICLLAICAAAIVGVHFMGKAKWLFAYNQAEPLVQLVWPLAGDMQAYYLKHGSNACALADITSDSEKLALANYRPVFTPDGTNIFKLTVNDRYGFAISSEFMPHWVVPEK